MGTKCAITDVLYVEFQKY